MIKPETIDKFYRGPHTLSGDLWFQWCSKRKGYPRETFTLLYGIASRSYTLRHKVKASRKTKGVGDIVDDPEVVAMLVERLTPEQKALCLAASIRHQGRPAGTSGVSMTPIEWKNFLSTPILSTPAKIKPYITPS